MRSDLERRIQERGQWRPSIRPERIDYGAQEKAMALVRLSIAGKKFWLMIERPYDHNPLTFPGGGINRGETRIQAAVRETEEETGVDLSPEAAVASYLGRVRLQEVRSDWEDIHVFLFTKTLLDRRILRPSKEGLIVLLSTQNLLENQRNGKLSRNATEALNLLMNQARAT